MPNAVLESFEAQRAEQVATMDSILAAVDGRDLVDAERGLLEACRDRITQLDAQITPLREFEALRAAHAESTGNLPAPTATARRPIDGDRAAAVYRSAGEYLVDYLRARGMASADHRPDPDAVGRIARAVDNQLTTDTPGILPTPIVGEVVSLIDANRPLVVIARRREGYGRNPGLDVHPAEGHPTYDRRRASRRENAAL